MNYLQQEFYKLQQGYLKDYFNTIEKKFAGFFLLDISTWSHLWIDHSFWIDLGHIDYDFENDLISWKKYLDNHNACNELKLQFKTKATEKASFTQTVKFRDSFGNPSYYELEGITLDDETDFPYRFVGVYRKLTTIKKMTIKDDRFDLILRNLSHEFRTPLNGILGTIQLLESTVLDDEQNLLIDTCKQSSYSLSKVVCDVLDYSSMEILTHLEQEQKQRLYTCFSLEFLIQDITEFFNASLSIKNLHFSYQIQKNVPDFIKGDYHKWRQLLSNIIGNAIKFSDKGKICLMIKRKNDLMIEMTVEDEGIGIRESTLSSFSSPFLKEDYSFINPTPGLGIGIAIAYKIIEEMHGEMNYWSNSGYGTKAFLQIPIK